uniref:cAMP responsive element binding protein 5a n=1 Tax=Cyprinus carpio TaxID=7962 RepID=A0A8C1TV31_CYPCA
MNVDQDRPYVCTAPGCSQRFQREDHLIIHRHKHEMTLKFPSIKCDSVLSDQTPTPTRFLRDCEEVGLFTDLELNQSQAEEETKPNFPAQASGQNQAHTETQHQQSQHHQFQPQQQQQCALAHLNQNQLHTHSSQPQSQCTATYSTSNKQSAPSCLHSRQTNALPGTSAVNRSKVMPAHSQPAVSNGSQNPLCHMMEMMSSQQHPLSHLQSASRHHAYQPHCHSQSPQRLAHQHQSQDQSHHSHAHHSPPAHLHPGSTHQTAPPLSHQPIPTQMSSTPKQTPCPQSPPQPSTARRRRTAGEDPDERRRKFLERNRAAATRCRQKRKVWVTSLERKAEELTHTNLQLQNEVTSLRTEVTQLKQILLAHKDCPVSVRQRETQSSPTGSPVQQHAIQHNSISTSNSTLPHTHLPPHSHPTNNTQL